MRFNIIYVPGTVKYLRLFALSLLKWPGCSLRLVANGCSREEEHLLKALSSQSRRLEYLALPFDIVVTHVQALTYLHSVERSKTFCFMDSDILATGDFMSELVPYLDQHAGVFSGTPIFCGVDEQTLSATYPKMLGRFSRTDTGICLGSTYLGMYDNQVLTQVIKSTGVGFGRYRWEEIPARYQSWLAEMDLRKEGYDTGKLLNLLLLAQGERLVFVESSNLLHIGGVSWQSLWKKGARAKTQRKRTIAQRVMWRIRRLTASSRPKRSRAEHIVTSEERSVARLAKTKTRRFIVSRYFAGLLQSLDENRPLPTVPDVGDPRVEEKIGLATASIVALYDEFREQLVR